MNPYANQYKNNHILTASPEQLLIMLYDGAIRFSTIAETAIVENDMANKGKYISKVIAILSEFSNTLDHSVDGELAANLDSLYAYMIKRLTEANIKNDTQPVSEVRTMLSELRETWQKAIEINNNSALQNHVGHKVSTLGAAA